MKRPLDIPELEKAPASDIKTKGWPGLMRKVRAEGAVVVTNHNHPEAVVVAADTYRQLVTEANATSMAALHTQSLKALQVKFDEHLSSLKDGTGLAKALSRPARKGMKITLGKSL